MVLRSRHDYLEAIRSRYRRAAKEAKSRILDEFCETCGYNRKYAIRLLGKPRRKPAGDNGTRPGPKAVYQDATLIEALKRIWFATDQMCSKKLKAAIPLWLPFYGMEFEPLDQASQEKLLQASPAHDRPVAQALQSSLQKGTLHHQAGNAAQKSDPGEYPSLGCYAARLLRGRHGCPLRQLHGRGLRPQSHLHRYPERMDRKQGSMGKRFAGSAEKDQRY